MADKKPRSDVFTAVAVLTLLVMALGIFVAVMQLNAYSRPSRLSSVTPKTKVERVDLLGPTGAEGRAGEGEGGTSVAPSVPTPEAGAEKP